MRDSGRGELRRVLDAPTHATRPAVPPELLAELQALGCSPSDDMEAGQGTGNVELQRRGGAGPSDHRAMVVDDTALMVPLGPPRTGARSPFRLRILADGGAAPLPADAFLAGDGGAVPPRPATRALLLRDGDGDGDGQDEILAEVSLPTVPRFYALSTRDGIPYPKIALLHAPGVLASTVMQSCVRYNDPAQACGFCAIGTSIEGGRTIPRKSPAQLAEVAAAAVRLDGVRQLVLTTGTPATPDRGAAHLAACAAAVKAAVPTLPIQAQFEPPEDFGWFARLKDSGVDALGMHLEAVEPAVRARVMPGKATVGVDRYFEAFAAAVEIFGRGQVSSYLIVGLGDRPASVIAMAERLLAVGVYPFVVPFVPIAGAPMAATTVPPAAEVMQAIYAQVGRLIRQHGVFSRDMKAGCGKCGACSAL